MSPQQQDRTKQKTQVCPEHGAYTSYNYIASIWSKCPACSRRRDQQQAEQDRADRRREKLAKATHLINQSGIPRLFQRSTLENYQASGDAGKAYALKMAKEFADNFADVRRTSQALIFVGNTGTGKTHLATAIGQQVMREHSASVVFSTAKMALSRITSTWSRAAQESEAQALRAFTACDLLILDEVGRTPGKEWDTGLMGSILNERYSWCRPTIITSNSTPEQLESTLGHHIVDRFRESKSIRVTFDWSSYRSTR